MDSDVLLQRMALALITDAQLGRQCRGAPIPCDIVAYALAPDIYFVPDEWDAWRGYVDDEAIASELEDIKAALNGEPA